MFIGCKTYEKMETFKHGLPRAFGNTNRVIILYVFFILKLKDWIIYSPIPGMGYYGIISALSIDSSYASRKEHQCTNLGYLNPPIMDGVMLRSCIAFHYW